MGDQREMAEQRSRQNLDVGIPQLVERQQGLAHRLGVGVAEAIEIAEIALVGAMLLSDGDGALSIPET
jgi:hypothetical protein